MKEMQELLFGSDGMSDADVLSLLATLKIQRKRWIGSFHPESRIRRLALESSGMRIGAGTHIAIGLVVIDDYTNNVSIGERCSIGSYITLMSATGPDNSVLKDHPEIQGAIKTKPIVIGNDCWIGSGCVIMPDITIGDMAVIGAGAVVTKDVYERQVVGGVPAKHMRTLT